MNELSKIAESITKRRKSLKITQNDLAEISCISLRSLKDIETGKGNPTLIQILKIFKSLGLKLKITAGNDND